MREEMAKSPKTRIQYASKYASCANYWKYSFEQNKALQKPEHQRQQRSHRKRVYRLGKCRSGPQSHFYGEVLPMIRQGYEDIKEYSVATAYAQEALVGPEAHLFAYRKGRMIEDLCDKETPPEKKKTEIKEALKDMAKAFFKDYNADLDTKIIAALFKIYNDNVDPGSLPLEVIDLVNKKYKGQL